MINLIFTIFLAPIICRGYSKVMCGLITMVSTYMSTICTCPCWNIVLRTQHPTPVNSSLTPPDPLHKMNKEYTWKCHVGWKMRL